MSGFHIVDEREATHGAFDVQAAFAQALKELLRRAPNWAALSLPQREALEQIATKQSRILHGDPQYADSWHDLAGYAELGAPKERGGV